MGAYDFFIFGFLFNRRNTFWITIISLLFFFSIEVSQLYQSQWINTIRNTTIGRLILGYGFLWSDLLAYTVGIAIGVLIEKQIIMV
ncbi:ribosomal maturation YjgA family protein [Alkaliphilus flagellatus]|uniref:ribosomal maturation YjgA family protein n=1 Tax=Alkaliphilus flagellatus TaxID=2841507 RepID=UPI002ED35A1B